MSFYIVVLGLLLGLLGFVSYALYDHVEKSKIYETIEVGGSTALLIALFMIGMFRGFDESNLSLDLYVLSIEAHWIDAVSTSVFFTVCVILTGILLYKEISTKNKLKTLQNGEDSVAIIPVYEDGNVLDRSVNSLLESDYEDLRIAIAYEPGDEDTIEEAERLSDGSPSVRTIENKYPGSKAGAIETVVEEFDSDYFVVFDADEIIKPNFISTAMYSMVENGFDVFQGRRIPEPTGMVESLAYCERITYHASYRLVELTGFKNCRSSSTAFTRDCFEKVGGYDDMLTEDLGFAHKAYRHGLSVKQCRNYTSQMEAPHSLKDFWGQRKRWRMGQVEVLHCSLKGGLTDGGIWHRRFISIGRMMGSMIGSVILITLISKLLLLAVLGATLLFLLPLISTSLVVAACAHRDKVNGDIDNMLYPCLMSWFVYPVFSLIMVKSLLEYLLTWDGTWYHVNKEGE